MSHPFDLNLNLKVSDIEQMIARLALASLWASDTSVTVGDTGVTCPSERARIQSAITALQNIKGMSWTFDRVNVESLAEKIVWPEPASVAPKVPNEQLKTLVESFRKQLRDAGGYTNSLTGVPASGVISMLDAFDKL